MPEALDFLSTLLKIGGYRKNPHLQLGLTWALPFVVLVCIEDSVAQSNGVRADDQYLAFVLEPRLKLSHRGVKVS